MIAGVFMAYGPGEQAENKLLPHVIRTLLRGEDPKLSSGKRGVDWVYVDDVTEGLVRSRSVPERWRDNASISVAASWWRFVRWWNGSIGW